MKHSVAIAVSTSLILSLACGQDSDRLFHEGKELLEEGDLDSAEHRLMAFLEINPASTETYYLLSRVHFKRYDLDKTREYLLIAIDMDERSEEYRGEFERINRIASLMGNAKRSLEGGDSYLAIGKFENVMNEFPEFTPVALYYMGLASMREEEIAEAARYFRDAAAKDPKYEKPRKALKGVADKIYNDGNQSFLRGDYEGAEEEYLKVLELDPNYHRAFYQLGVIRTKLGEYDKALTRYEQSVQIEPTYAKGWFALGLAHQRNGDFQTALESLDRATEANPAYARAYAQKGVIYLKQGDYPASENEYRRAIQSDPAYAKPYEDLGKIYVAQEKYEEAIQVLITATALNGKSWSAWTQLAQAYNALGQCESAKEAALSATDIKENYAPAWYELGISEVCLGNKTAALKAFEKARRDRSWRKTAEYEIDKIRHPEKYQNR